MKNNTLSICYGYHLFKEIYFSGRNYVTPPPEFSGPMSLCINQDSSKVDRDFTNSYDACCPNCRLVSEVEENACDTATELCCDCFHGTRAMSLIRPIEDEACPQSTDMVLWTKIDHAVWYVMVKDGNLLLTNSKEHATPVRSQTWLDHPDGVPRQTVYFVDEDSSSMMSARFYLSPGNVGVEDVSNCCILPAKAIQDVPEIRLDETNVVAVEYNLVPDVGWCNYLNLAKVLSKWDDKTNLNCNDSAYEFILPIPKSVVEGSRGKVCMKNKDDANVNATRRCMECTSTKCSTNKDDRLEETPRVFNLCVDLLSVNSEEVVDGCSNPKLYFVDYRHVSNCSGVNDSFSVLRYWRFDYIGKSNVCNLENLSNADGWINCSEHIRCQLKNHARESYELVPGSGGLAKEKIDSGQRGRFVSDIISTGKQLVESCKRAIIEAKSNVRAKAGGGVDKNATLKEKLGEAFRVCVTDPSDLWKATSNVVRLDATGSTYAMLPQELKQLRTNMDDMWQNECNVRPFADAGSHEEYLKSFAFNPLCGCLVYQDEQIMDPHSSELTDSRCMQPCGGGNVYRDVDADSYRTPSGSVDPTDTSSACHLCINKAVIQDDASVPGKIIQSCQWDRGSRNSSLPPPATPSDTTTPTTPPTPTPAAGTADPSEIPSSLLYATGGILLVFLVLIGFIGYQIYTASRKTSAV